MILSDAHVPCLQFPALMAIPFVRHGIFTRHGGVSLPPFDALNVSYASEDAKENVDKNRELIYRAMGNETLAFAHQVHGADILVVEDPPSGPGLATMHCGKGDALVTGLPGINLVLQVADCQPVLLADPVKRVVGAVHSGWRGSVINIVGKTIDAMTRRFGCNPGDLYAGIGPSLGPCCGEFTNFQTELPQSLWKYETHHRHFDFWSLTCDQLTAKGVKKEHVQVSGICTKCESHRFFSYRKENKTGRFAAVIGLMQPKGNRL